ncbi:PLD nuclease N-terminal domain-containing protein [Catalinimonas niigatensis]|uniref:PLD nuclease N-terminal domain-containing protein n=1 Tax=Catalinimonas niigatensis TaxID=1397264 RepID=UPI0026653735|nr:PLD nuclease N-terminal domain-containing protein [Catalinimonas niigatensis]WPP48313.1 PLD nuclease N-terminal domain-containing protein [Catalinimonas niigatensis]
MALGALGGWKPLLLVVLSAVMIGLWLAALRDIGRRNFKTSLSKWQWIAIVVFLPIVGALAYIFWGRGDNT